VDKLYRILLRLYYKELKNLNLGYPNDEKAIEQMMDLIHVIEFTESGNPSANEIFKILEYYG